MSPWSEVITLVSLTSAHPDTMYQLYRGLRVRLVQCSRGRLFPVTDAGGEAGPEAGEDGYRGWPQGLGGLVQHHLARLLLSSPRWFSRPLSSDHPLPPVSYTRPIISVITNKS